MTAHIQSRWLRMGLIAAGLAVSQAAPSHAQFVDYLDQGWTTQQREFFYRTTQGSRLIPYDIFITLEMADSEQRFAGITHLRSLGFIYDLYGQNNPDFLPIGFVKDETNGADPAFGLTCAACHTRDISFDGTRLRIDGGQGHGDLERFLQDMEAALLATLTDGDKLQRMRQALGLSFLESWGLYNRVEAAYLKLQKENESNRPGHGALPNDPGPGRLDAFAHIKNRVSDYVYEDGYLDSNLNNIDATAPVSYPHLWTAPYLDYVQWPSVAPNWGPGSLGRNVGEVLGVFAETTVERNFWGQVEVTSSANVDNLIAIEDTLLALDSPQWPDAFPALDPQLVAEGDVLFEQYCGSCHVEVERGVPDAHVDTFAIGADLLGTDPTMADNMLFDHAPQGKLGPSYKAEDLIAPTDILSELVGKIVGPYATLSFILEQTAKHKQPYVTAARNVEVASGEDEAHTYKARPLNGIWATAPYMHNGAVRTLVDIMKPGPEREEYFCVGTTEYDPVAGGLVGDCLAPDNTYLFDTNKVGNSRLGHEYGFGSDTRYPHLTAHQKDAIVEYMKSL